MIDFDTANSRETLFVEVLLPLSIPKLYTYRVPFNLNEEAAVGKRCVVQFGKSKMYTAIIAAISKQAPLGYEAKYLIDIIDDKPVVYQRQLKLWNWIAEYYLCYAGEVMSAALPSVLKLASETKIVLNQEFEYDKSELSDKEYVLVDALEIQHELSIADISKILGQKTVFPILRSLFEKKILFISEELNEKFKPRKVKYVQLNPFYSDKENLRALFEVLEKTPKQLDALLTFIKLSKDNHAITRTILAESAGVSDGVIKALIEKDIFQIQEKVVSRFSFDSDSPDHQFQLSAEQSRAYNEIQKFFISKPVTLLYGVTSSGKTQIYIKLIEEYLEQDKQVLYLLPEIALTAQIIDRLQHHFGNKIAVYHSKFNDNEKAEIWEKVLNKEVQIILGARSALFLPFKDLGIVIVDEEHEASYKQYDPAPRYHARDVAIVLGNIYQAKVLLGSATPSLETYFNAKSEKYGLVKLMERYSGVKMPEIDVISISEQRAKKAVVENFSNILLQSIEETVANKEQVILFQNRRGYVPILICKTCGNTPKCVNCDVSLTYHKSSNRLHCHYCGYHEDNITECVACGSKHIEYKGLGTEKVEDDLKALLPNIRIGRLDYDTTRNKNAHMHIITDFEEKRLDVLVGTQMVAKGLDFDNVTLIGIINADNMLQFPDFRAYERSFQMLSQVAGRAGRRDKQGKVLIQTYDTKNRIIQQVVKNDFEGMFLDELRERKHFSYPPYFRIIQIDIKHKDFNKNLQIAEKFAQSIRQGLGKAVIGPQIPLIGRIRNYYIQTVLVKIDLENQSIYKVKEFLKNEISGFEANKDYKGAFIVANVDPY
ncbi:primosomal protein N' [Pseudopedobacter saltans DSM 12145]|uniref:Replication restart protein PriA n=1 Tax=Pseudopedobacter saltans (strain ATCC 51119 / DSM 12145 / JCM 21818 / CCUG 39354 / LMG 10337 / NBRC 100064 / NCIMB 13643) TaxID=762903 RepID=F0S848_PSESL|nr:primosomal protein N' [Pseudopedobacter saltans]ADY52310.1 primosomal protein N' [Pseudopedobacter saltans DSM 12145]